MIEVCDPDADLDVLKKLIKMNTGHNIKLTKEQTCQVYDDIKAGKLPLPPLIMSSSKIYLVDKKSPLKPNDYDILFDSSSKRNQIKIVARKVGLKQLDQMTKSQMIDSIGKRLKYMKIHEPVKIGTKRTTPVKKEGLNNTAVINNTAVNFTNTTLNANGNVNRLNGNGNVNRLNGNVNRLNGNGNVNRLDGNENLNTARRNENLNTARKNENLNTARKNVPTSRVNFPKGGLFMKDQRPKFLNGRVSAVKKPTESLFTRIFKPKQKDFIPSSKFKGGKKGYVFKTGNQGTGYYINVGAAVVQGPMPAPSGASNIDINEAIEKIKKLQLRREKLFLNKIGTGGFRGSDVVAEAVKYKTLENDFITKLSKMTLSNTNRNTFIQRMASENLEQLEAEAQIKSGNVVQNDEQKMNTILATLPFINNSSKTNFKARAKAGGTNINSLIEEAKKENETKRSTFITNQKTKFMGMITNVKLSDEDKNSLAELIDNKTNLNSLKNRANKLVEQRIAEKKALMKQNLLTYLTPLKINQTNKNGFLRRFNNGESISVLKRVAKEREDEVARSGNENVRTRLVRNLNTLNLNAQNKNTIMSKFNNGNRNVTKLIEEAKRLKNERNVGKIGTERERLTALAKQLGVDTNFSNNISKLDALNQVTGLEQKIRNAGGEKIKGTFAEKIQALSKVASSMNLNASIQSNILKLKNNTELNTMKVRIIGAGKQKLSNRAGSLGVKFSRNIANVNSVNKLKPLRNRINNAGRNKESAKTQKDAAILTEKRQELKNYINRNITLPQNKKNAFVRQVNLNSTNLIELRKEINTEIQSIKNTKRTKNLDELERYLQPLNINKSKFIQRFKNSNISLENIKVAINKEVTIKGDLTSKKRTLSSKIDEAKTYNVAFNFNTNTSPLNSPEKVEELNRRVDKVIESVINKGRNTLSNKIINTNVKNDFMNKVTAAKTLKNLKNIGTQINAVIASKKAAKNVEITKYMKNMGLDNTNIQLVAARNLSLNDSRQMANDILDKKKRLELTKLLDEKKVPVADRKQFYNKISKNSNIRTIEKNVEEYLIQKSRETLSNITQVLNKYNLKKEDREAILKNWDYYENMSVLNVKNKASTLSNEFKKEKSTALRRYLTDELKLKQNDVETVMKNFNLNPRNMNALRTKATTLKNLSSGKNRITERIRKARNENGLNLKFNVNKIKSMNNAKNLNAKINQAYIGKAKKNLSRRALNRNVNVSDELNAIKTMNNVQKLKNKLNGLIGGKKQEDLKKLEEVIKNLNQENKNRFLQKFKNQNNSLGNILENVQTFKNVLTKQKFEGQKQELYKYINETLNLDVKNRNSIMFEFNTSKNLNVMKQKANAIKKSRNIEKIATSRKKLENILKPLNLSQENKNSILTKYDKQPGNIEMFETNAKSLIQQRKNESRAGEREELMRFMNNLGLSNQNKNMIVGYFNQSPNKTLKSSKNNATSMKKTRQEEKLENTFNNLANLTNDDKSKLRMEVKSGVNVNTVINSAKRLNSNIKAKKVVEQNVINYVTSKNLGQNGEKLIKNFRNGLLTQEKVKEEADKKRASMNASIVANKKARLRNFMKNTLLTNPTKNKYLERVGLNTNLSTIEKNIQKDDEELKSKRNTFARKQAELTTYLNGLISLTKDQKSKLVSKIKNNTTNIERIKSEGKKIDEQMKKATKKDLSAEENKFNAAGAQNAYLKKAKEEVDKVARNNFNATAALELLNRNRNIADLRASVNKSSLPTSVKQRYIKQIEKPGTNLKPIRNLLELDEKRVIVSNAAKKKFGPLYRLSKWKPIIDNAKSVTALETINKNLKNRIELEGELKSSKIPSKRNLLGKVMRSNMKVKNLRRTFEKELNNVTKRMNFEKNTSVSELYVPETNFKGKKFKVSDVNPLALEILNRGSAISTVNRLKKISQKAKTNYKAQIKQAKSNAELENIKTRATQNDNAIRMSEKKAKALKAVEKAANAYVAARKPKPPNAPKPNKPSFKALVQKNKERRVMNAVKIVAQKTAISEATGAERVKLAKKFAPRTQANVKRVNNAGKMFKANVRKAAEGATMMNKSSYQAKINSRNFKIPKNRKKIFTSRIQRATTLGQVLKAYENAQSELPK